MFGVRTKRSIKGGWVKGEKRREQKGPVYDECRESGTCKKERLFSMVKIIQSHVKVSRIWCALVAQLSLPQIKDADR